MKRKTYMNEQTTVSAVVGRVNANGKYVEVCIDDIEVGKLPDDMQEALDTDYDIAIRLDSDVSIAAFAKNTCTLTDYLEGKAIPNYLLCFFKELSTYPPDVMWYYSNLPVTNR